MKAKGLDIIHIRDLRIVCIIGINPRERVEPQEVVVNLDMYVDLREASLSDDIDKTVDYKVLKDQLLSRFEKSQYFLLEKMATEICNEVFAFSPRIERIQVSVDKPGALTGARSVAVSLGRMRDDV